MDSRRRSKQINSTHRKTLEEDVFMYTSKQGFMGGMSYTSSLIEVKQSPLADSKAIQANVSVPILVLFGIVPLITVCNCT